MFWERKKRYKCVSSRSDSFTEKLRITHSNGSSDLIHRDCCGFLTLSRDVGREPSNNERVPCKKPRDEAGEQERFSTETVLRFEAHSLVAKKKRSAVSLTRKRVEHCASSNAGKNDGGDDGGFHSVLDGEPGGEDDDQDLKSTEGWREKGFEKEELRSELEILE